MSLDRINSNTESASPSSQQPTENLNLVGLMSNDTNHGSSLPKISELQNNQPPGEQVAATPWVIPTAMIAVSVAYSVVATLAVCGRR